MIEIKVTGDEVRTVFIWILPLEALHSREGLRVAAAPIDTIPAAPSSPKFRLEDANSTEKEEPHLNLNPD
jgi:hypothetical protein